MTDSIPRWGNRQRDIKAQAIWATMEAVSRGKLKDAAWLDVGCGSGGIAAGLAVRVRSVIGVDPEPWDAWDELLRANSNLKFMVGKFDEDAVPVPSASVDVAVCNQVYEHVGDPRALIRNIATVLKSGGVCYFAGPNLLWPVEPHVFWPFVHWLPRSRALALMRALGSSKTAEFDAFSAHIWKLRRWFAEAGFEETCVVQERLCAGLEAGAHATAASFVKRIPKAVFMSTQPLHPSFVFLLRKVVPK